MANKKTKIKKSPQPRTPTVEDALRYRRDPIAFLEEHFFIGKDRLIVIEDWQTADFLRRLFYVKNVDGVKVSADDPCVCERGSVDGDENGIQWKFGDCCIHLWPRWYNEALLGMPKKNGKTEIAAAIAFVEFFFGEMPEVYFTSNSRQQASSLAFGKFRAAIKRNRGLSRGLKIGTTMIRNPANEGVATVLPHNPNTIAGLNPSFVHFDELWGFVHKDSVEVYNELTISPARVEALNLTTSYSGHRKSGPLWDLCERGRDKIEYKKKGKVAAGSERFYYYWTNENKASWITKQFLDSRRAAMPEVVFKRLHENRWVTDGAFFTEEMLARARVKGLMYGDSVHGGTVGVDLGLRKDRTALGRVVCDADGNMVLVYKRMWRGEGKKKEVKIVEVEDEMLRQFKECRARAVLCDPWQLRGSIQRLEYQMTIEEYVFTAGSLGKLAMVLYEAFNTGRVRIPDSDEYLIAELRGLQLLNTPAGYKFDHTEGEYSDQAVMLALAIYGELEGGYARGIDEILSGIDGGGGVGAGDGGGIGDDFSVLPGGVESAIDGDFDGGGGFGDGGMGDMGNW